MPSLQHGYAVERGCVSTDLDPKVLALLERLSRINYVIGAHRAAIAMQSRRRAEVQAELERLEATA